ncbi:MAG TPA: class I SAM-dependent methyltransferase, partial [Candidatus Hypogeohydataceae bacterium YC40]
MNRVVTVALFLALLLLTPILTAEKCEKEAFFDMMAQAWEEMSQHNTGELARIREIISSFGLKEGETVLDAGCGTGRLIPFLLKEVGRNGRIYALDCSQEMLLIAKQKQYDGNVSF